MDDTTLPTHAPSREDLIRERAYELWQGEGCPDGAADRHWQQAEASFNGADQPEAGDPVVTTMSAATSRRKRA